MDEVRANHGEFEHFFAEVFDQLDSMVRRLADRQQEFERAAGERQRQESARLEAQLKEMASRQGSLDRRRIVLETEIEALRRREGELTAQLAEEKRRAARQQGLWIKELQRIRRLLEKSATPSAKTVR